MSPQRPVTRTATQVALGLALAAALATTTLTVVHWITRGQIEKAGKQLQIDRLQQILPLSLYNNDLLEDTILVSHSALGTDQAQKIWRARLDDKPVAAILTATAPDGYGGPITLLIAILANGEISAVRVLRHRETPGLGDDIEISRSDWILGFNGKSLNSLSNEQWQVKPDGGVFDQFTGATITPRAIVSAIHSALGYFRQNQEIIFARQ